MMLMPTSGHKNAAVTPDVIAVMRPEGDEPLNNDISERLLDATGLLALERIEKRETERQYQDLLQSANSTEQVLILMELVEQRRIENTALADENRRLLEQLQLMRMEDTPEPFTN